MADLGSKEAIATMFSEPQFDGTLKALRDYPIRQIIGNSANKSRRTFAETLAGQIGGNYIHPKMSSVDEIDKYRYLQLIGEVDGTEKTMAEMYPDLFQTWKGASNYLYVTVLSKIFRYFPASEQKFLAAGVNLAAPLNQSLLLLGDTESWMGDGIQGKPLSDDEAKDQIHRVASGIPYFILGAHLAAIADIASGNIAISLHTTPIRAGYGLSSEGRYDLKNIWYSLYQNPMVDITPGSASASNTQLWPYVEVGIFNNPNDQVSNVDNFKNPEDLFYEWVPFLDLSGMEREETLSNLSGGAFRPFVHAIAELMATTEIKIDESESREMGSSQWIQRLTPIMTR